MSQVKNPARRAVDKVAVVRYIEQCSGIGVDRTLKNLAGFDIQMIGRLIEHDEIGV